MQKNYFENEHSPLPRFPNSWALPPCITSAGTLKSIQECRRKNIKKLAEKVLKNKMKNAKRPTKSSLLAFQIMFPARIELTTSAQENKHTYCLRFPYMPFHIFSYQICPSGIRNTGLFQCILSIFESPQHIMSHQQKISKPFFAKLKLAKNQQFCSFENLIIPINLLF